MTKVYCDVCNLEITDTNECKSVVVINNTRVRAEIRIQLSVSAAKANDDIHICMPCAVAALATNAHWVVSPIEDLED